jgi:hypothetical protein
VSIDMTKIENLHSGKDGMMIGRCPACSEHGGDKKGNHFFIYPNGAYGCVAHPGDKMHTKRIKQLAGRGSGHFPTGGERRLNVRAQTYAKLDQNGRSRILRMVDLKSLQTGEINSAKDDIEKN